MCLALSGRCLLSAHLTGRSANLGMCTHPCRYDYRPVAVAFEERTRPGEVLWEAAGTAGAAGPEDPAGTGGEGGFTALFSPDDVCLVKHLAWLWRVGVDSLKIEGRMKSGGYLAQVLDAYRTALDDLADPGSRRFRPGDYLAELSNAASRELTTGFFLPGPGGEAGKVKYGARDAPKRPVRPIVARVLRQEGEGRWRVAVRGPWDASRDAEILAPGLARPVLRAGEYGLETDLGEGRGAAHSGTELILRADAPELREHLFLRAR
jgi:putative protease